MIDKEKIMEYMDWVYLVNSEEVYCVAQDAYAFEVYRWTVCLDREWTPH